MQFDSKGTRSIQDIENFATEIDNDYIGKDTYLLPYSISNF